MTSPSFPLSLRGRSSDIGAGGECGRARGECSRSLSLVPRNG